MSVPVFRRFRTIGPGDIDDVDHVSNLVWLRFAIELAEAHCAAVGLDDDRCAELDGMWLARRHEIEYLHPVSLAIELVEETWLSELKGSHCIRQFRFRSQKTFETLVEGASRWVWVDPAGNRPKRIPPQVLSRFEVLEELR